MNNSKTTTAASATAIQNSATAIQIYRHKKSGKLYQANVYNGRVANGFLIKDGALFGRLRHVDGPNYELVEVKNAPTAAWIETPTACYLVGAVKDKAIEQFLESCEFGSEGGAQVVRDLIAFVESLKQQAEANQLNAAWVIEKSNDALRSVKGGAQ